MKLSDRISAFSKLSTFLLAVTQNQKEIIEEYLFSDFNEFKQLISELHIHNPWFTENFVSTQLQSLALSSTKPKLEKWLTKYKNIIDRQESKKVGVIMAGNIPFVGFHDFISVLITGHTLIIKLSSKDQKLPKQIIKTLLKIEPQFNNKIIIVEQKLSDFEAIIATGSNNTARYFKYYFSKVPSIIRKSRNSVAVLSGNETKAELNSLTDDILLYFGLGCRNVSKIYVPENYNFNKLFEAIYRYKDLANHNKFANNYSYNRTIYLLNNDVFLENNFFIIKQDISVASPISVLHYENYSKIDHVKKILESQKDQLQCVVSNIPNLNNQTINLGQAQFPELTDYEDGINTLDFLTTI